MSQPPPVQHLLWDWNGTLLDDLDLCLSALNVLCARRGMRPVAIDEYREKFTFPVIEHYKAVGFDFSVEPFSVPAQEWVDLYTAGVWTETHLYSPAVDVLTRLHDLGLHQSVLSAYHQEMLVKVMRHFGVAGFFETLLGLGDHYAESKLDLGLAWLEQSHLDPATVLLIGDTLHDHEVAAAMGIGSVLIAQGHQSRRRLETAGVPVLSSLEDVVAFVNGVP